MSVLEELKGLLTRSSFWIYVVLAVHFGVCLLCLSKAPGDAPYHLAAGITVSQEVQWAYGAFCLFSVFCIIQAYIGAVYMLESHLNAYYYLLALSFLVDVCFIGIFIWSWLSAFGVILLLSLYAAFKVGALYVTSKYSKVVRSQYNAELLPHLKSALGRSFNVAPFEPARDRPFRAATMQERPSHTSAPGGWQTVPPEGSRLVRVVH
ncbi:unnamed protein product [Effrenium voratum]|nr:unnamed protein product [Effrenium voratum]